MRANTSRANLTTAPLTMTPLTFAVGFAGAVAAAVPATVVGLRMNPDLFGAGLLNPDSAMRLVRLHDILAAHAPLHAVARDGASTVLHWSHLLDSLLLLLAAPMAGALGWDRAVYYVGLLSGPLSLGALGLAMAWAAAPLAGRGWAWLGAVAAGASPAVAGYGMPGVVHHHILLAVCAVMACGWALRLLRGAPPGSGGVALGAWAGAGLWLSPETLPFSLMALGALWAAWLQRPTVPRALLAASTSFAAVAAAAWAADPPVSGWFGVEPDRLSLPFVLLALGAAAVAVLARSVPRRAAVLVGGAVLAGSWLAAFPQVLHGTEGLMSAEAAAVFFGDITEMAPVRGAGEAVEMLLGGTFACAALLVFAVRRPSLPLLHALLCSLVLVVLAALHVRFAPYAALAGAVMLPIALASITGGAVHVSLQPFARLALVLPLLLAPILVPTAATAEAAGPRHVCPIRGVDALLAPYDGQVVLTDVNDTPDVLYRSRVHTVGSLYHRGIDGFLLLRAAWRSVPDGEPSAAFRATGARLVLACPGHARSALVEGLAHDTLLDRLIANEPPAWLHRVADAGPGGYVLYGVDP